MTRKMAALRTSDTLQLLFMTQALLILVFAVGGGTSIVYLFKATFSRIPRLFFFFYIYFVATRKRVSSLGFSIVQRRLILLPKILF